MEGNKIYQKSIGARTIHRMGAWVNDSSVVVKVVKVVPNNNNTKRTKERILLHPRTRTKTRRRIVALKTTNDNTKDNTSNKTVFQQFKYPISTILSLRRQFIRQLSEWPIQPLHKSRTKAINSHSWDSGTKGRNMKIEN